jgi:predicted exporter
MSGAESSSRGTDAAAYLGVAIWGLLVALVVLYLVRDLRVDTGLGAMLPEDAPEIDRVLRQGPVARLLILSIEGGRVEDRLAASRSLARALRSDPAVVAVFNDEPPPLELDREIFRYRYLLEPDTARDPFSQAALTDALVASKQLAAVPGQLTRELIQHDPTGAMLRLIETWTRQAPRTGPSGAWEDPDRTRALLVVETAVPGDDLDGQAALLDRLRELFTERYPGLALRMSGYPVFAVQNRATVRAEINRLAGLAGAAVLVILVSVFRRARPVLLAWLPLFTGLLAGTAAVLLLDGDIHGITLAFGATLLGIAVDQPLHVLSHARPGESTVASTREIWPTLAIGAATTAISYLALLWSGHPVLRQLGVFNAAGIIAAALSARFAVAPLAGQTRSTGDAALWRRISTLPSRWWLAPLVLLLAALLLLWNPAGTALWEDDIAQLSPIDSRLQHLDAELRADLGLPEPSRFLLVSAPDAETVLRAEEALRPALAEAVQRGALKGFEMASDYLPSRAAQEARRHALPNEETLRSRIQVAAAASGFRAAAFEPFIEDVAATRGLPTLGPDDVPPGPWKNRVSTLLSEHAGSEMGIVTLNGPKPAGLLAQISESAQGARIDYVDMRRSARQIMQRLRTQALTYLGWGLLASVLLLALVLRDPGRVIRVVLPVIAALVATAAFLRLSGHPLSLFHLAALLLVAGVSIDYSLFASRHEKTDAEAARTLRSISVCLLTTVAAFAGLVISALPLLREIGLTVVLGVSCAYTLALFSARPAKTKKRLEAATP